MSDPGIEIQVFEYELQGYGNDQEAPNAIINGLLPTSSPDCGIISYNTTSSGETRSCDVLTGTHKPFDPDNYPTDAEIQPILTAMLPHDFTLTPTGMNPLNGSDLLYLACQFPTKLPTGARDRTYQTDWFNDTSLFAHCPTLKPFYQTTFPEQLKKTMLGVLVPSWSAMIAESESTLSTIKASTLFATDTAIIKELTEKIKATTTTITSINDTLSKEEMIETYTMVQSIAPSSKEQYIIVGDLHGSLHTFVRLLYRWRILGYMDEKGQMKKGLNLIFLGDVSDRGVWGYELYYTIFYLFLINQDATNTGRVYLTRGNHEEFDQNSNDGFLDNLNAIFPPSDPASLAIIDTRMNNIHDPSLPIKDPPPNPQHRLINIILSYLPSAHRLAYPGSDKFVYLAH